MGYQKALEKAWQEFEASGSPGRECTFLGRQCKVDPEKHEVFCAGEKARDHVAILTLHYLAEESGMNPAGKWISFQELEGGKGYYPAFRKRVIKPIADSFGKNPSDLIKAGEKFGGQKIEHGDAGIRINVFEKVPLGFVVWSGDEEFGPDANVLFDAGVKGVFSSEDMVVLAEIATRSMIKGK